MSEKTKLGVEDLESVATDATATKAKKEKQPQTAEETAAIEAAVEKVKAFGVSDEFAEVLKMVPMWQDTEANKETKLAVIEHFGGPEKFKDYVDTKFQDELKVINGLGTVLSRCNNIKSFYARREGAVKSPKVKTTQVSIGGAYYLVNAEYLASLAGTPAEEKRALLLDHADTKPNDAIEIL